MFYFYLVSVTGTSLAFLYGSLFSFVEELQDFPHDGWGDGDLVGPLMYVLVFLIAWALHWVPLRKMWPSVNATRQSMAKLIIGLAALGFLLGSLVSGAELGRISVEVAFFANGDPAQFQGAFLMHGVFFLVSLILWWVHWTEIKLHSPSPKAKALVESD